MPTETPQLNLTELHRDAIKAANSSWSETDKLYVSVCSALIALAGFFGWGKPESKLPLLIVGALLIFLAFNWIVLITRYRYQILRSLSAIYDAQANSKIKTYFADERKHFRRESLWDYFIVRSFLWRVLL
jgi:hypothetical protein